MIARTLVGSVGVPLWGFTAACFASPAAWICADAFLIPACVRCIHRLRRHKDQFMLAHHRAVREFVRRRDIDHLYPARVEHHRHAS